MGAVGIAIRPRAWWPELNSASERISNFLRGPGERNFFASRTPL
jgi:hypothetical protein